MYVLADGEIILVIAIQLIIAIYPAVIADVGLWFVKSPEPFVAPVNDEVVFECSLNVPAEIIRWRHGRKFIQQNHTASARISSTSRLIIKVVDESQLGDYQCVAWFGASALASVPAKLTLAEIKPFPYMADKQYRLTVGNTIPIQCPAAVSNPPALIQYFRNEKKLSQNNQVFLPNSNSLLLHNVSEDDSGVYSCSATNYITGQTITTSYKVHLEVLPSNNHSIKPHAPKFISTPQTNYIAQSGSNITIECIAVGEPPPRVTWRKAGGSQQSLPKNRTDLLIGGLYLRNIVPDDTGEYVCEMNNGILPPLVHKVLLHVQEPPVILKEPNRTLVEEQGNTELSCEVSGNPIPIVSWTLNGEPVQNDSHTTTLGSRLLLYNAQKKHAGIYQCFASNSVGMTYGSAMLQVSPKEITLSYNSSDYITDHNEFDYDGKHGGSSKRNSGHNHNHNRKDHRGRKHGRKHKDGVTLMVPPSRPNVTRLSDRSVMVRWHVASNDGLPILFFKVQYREVASNDTTTTVTPPINTNNDGNSGVKSKTGNSRWMTSNEDIPPHIRSYEIDRLEPNRVYKFRIAAVYSNNDNKLSQNSYKFHLQQGVPTDRSSLVSPALIEATALSPTSIQIQWQYLNGGLTAVDGFYIYYRATSNAGDYNKATVEGDKVRSYVITHLQPDTSYDVKIQSFTVGTASNFSSIVSRKTLFDPNSTTESPNAYSVKPTSNVNDLTVSGSNTTQLLIIFGAVIAVVSFTVILIVICFLKHRSSEDDDTMEGEEIRDKNNENVITIHSLEAVSANGYSAHNGKMLNGATKMPHRNGFATTHAPINITSNPLAVETKHDKNPVEMTSMPRHNNNGINNNRALDVCSKNETDNGHDIKTAHDRSKWRLKDQKLNENFV